jgi:hypothetical protein
VWSEREEGCVPRPWDGFVSCAYERERRDERDPDAKEEVLAVCEERSSAR